MERDRIEPGNRLQAADVVGDDRVQAGERRPERGGRLGAFGDRPPVGVDAEQIDAVGPGEVVEPIAVEIGQLGIVAIVVPLLNWAGHREMVVRYGSMAIMAAGLYWTVTRLFLG